MWGHVTRTEMVVHAPKIIRAFGLKLWLRMSWRAFIGHKVTLLNEVFED